MLAIFWQCSPHSRADNRLKQREPTWWRKYWEFNPYKSNENTDRHKQSLMHFEPLVAQRVENIYSEHALIYRTTQHQIQKSIKPRNIKNYSFWAKDQRTRKLYVWVQMK